MKVVSTFLYSEEFEQNCLEVKLNCESECVEEWIGIESPYTFRGEEKGCSLYKVLSQSKFNQFRNRVTIIPIVENLFEKLCSGHNEKEYFKVEFASRAACWDYINSKYDEDTRVIVGDVDELIDFSDKKRRDRFFDICSSRYSNGFQLEQLKFWWDFDNLSFYPKFMPVHTIQSLRSGKTSFTHRNNDCQQIKCDDMILAFEYAYSFSPEHNFRKCSTFAHDRYTQECITHALALNSWHRAIERNEVLGRDPYDWFETIQLTENNSPIFVRENLNRLKVNSVNPHYASYRVPNFNISPHPALNYGFLGKNKIKNECNYYKR